MLIAHSVMSVTVANVPRPNWRISNMIHTNDADVLSHHASYAERSARVARIFSGERLQRHARNNDEPAFDIFLGEKNEFWSSEDEVSCE